MKLAAPAIFLLLLFPAMSASVQWSYSAQGAITGKPLIFADKAVFSTYEGKIYGFSADRGSVLWLYDDDARLSVPIVKISTDLLAATNTNGKLAFITQAGKETAAVSLPSPALYIAGASGTVYISLKDGVRAYSSSGKSIWNFTLASPAGPISVYGDTVYFTSGGKLYSVSAKTGAKGYSVPAEDSFLSAPVESGGSVYFGATDGRLYAFDSVSGRQRWSYPTGGWVQTTPAVAGDSIFFGSDDGNFYSVTDSGKLRFAFRAGEGVWAEPAPYSSNGRQLVAFGSNNGNMYGLDAATGEQVWSFSAGGRLGPAAEKGGAFLFGTSRGKFYSLFPSPICSFSWPQSGAAAGDWPVTVEGTAYSDSGVGQVEVRLEGGGWQVATGREKWRADLDFTGMPYGAFKAECRVSDASGTQQFDYSSITLVKTQNVQLQRMSVSAPSDAASNQTITISARDSRGVELSGVTLSVSGVKKAGDSPFLVVLGKSGAIPITIEKPGFEPVSFSINSTGGPDLLLPLLAVIALAAAAFFVYRKMSSKKVVMRGQGATEYLVLLAVVLIVALVSVALLGFFPGMASDAQITQSQAYWQSATPIAITEIAAWGTTNIPTGRGLMYMRLRNSGAYPITITKIIGTTSTNYISQAELPVLGNTNLSAFLTIAPGEETHLGYPVGRADSGTIYREIDFYKASGASSNSALRNIASDCLPTSPYGTLSVKNFGFEYTETIDGQAITKRQIGTAPLIVKCGPPAW